MLDKLKSKLTLRNILLCASGVVAIVGLIIYIVVATTGYFVGETCNVGVILCSIFFILGIAATIIFDDKISKFDTLIIIALAVLIIFAFVLFIIDKEEVVGEMLIPVNHPQKQVDAATTSVVGIIFYGISFILLAVASFLDNKKKEIAE